MIVVGLDHAGKTSILYKLKLNSEICTLPTISCQLETIKHKGKELDIMDAGGSKPLRALWRELYAKCDAIMFVIDSADRSRVEEASLALECVLRECGKHKKPILILANKQDLPDAMTESEIKSLFSPVLHLDSQRKIHVQPCSVKDGTGLNDGLDWLTSNCSHKPKFTL